jgi:hypothetical protein
MIFTLCLGNYMSLKLDVFLERPCITCDDILKSRIYEPFVFLLVETFDIVRYSSVVSPANNEYLVIDDFGGHVKSIVNHVRDWRPCISFRVVLLATARADGYVRVYFGLPSCKYIYYALSYCIQKSGKFPRNVERTIWNNKQTYV